MSSIELKSNNSELSSITVESPQTMDAHTIEQYDRLLLTAGIPDMVEINSPFANLIEDGASNLYVLGWKSQGPDSRQLISTLSLNWPGGGFDSFTAEQASRLIQIRAAATLEDFRGKDINPALLEAVLGLFRPWNNEMIGLMTRLQKPGSGITTPDRASSLLSDTIILMDTTSPRFALAIAETIARADIGFRYTTTAVTEATAANLQVIAEVSKKDKDKTVLTVKEGSSDTLRIPSSVKPVPTRKTRVEIRVIPMALAKITGFMKSVLDYKGNTPRDDESTLAMVGHNAETHTAILSALKENGAFKEMKSIGPIIETRIVAERA
jgi:hypothetical protein